MSKQEVINALKLCRSIIKDVNLTLDKLFLKHKEAQQNDRFKKKISN